MTSWTPTTDADRARTILALGGPAHWRLVPDNEIVIAPFIAHGGTPLLLVDHEDLEQIFGQQRLGVTLQPSPQLGTLVISGRPRVPTATECGGEVRQYRHEHAECGPACGAAAVPVALDLVSIALSAPGSSTLVPMAVSELRAGTPQESFLAVYAIAHHLNCAHTEELLGFAAEVARIPPASLVAAHVTEITAAGLTLTLIDQSGATPFEVRFERSVTSIPELGAELHRLLADASVRRYPRGG